MAKLIQVSLLILGVLIQSRGAHAESACWNAGDQTPVAVMIEAGKTHGAGILLRLDTDQGNGGVARVATADHLVKGDEAINVIFFGSEQRYTAEVEQSRIWGLDLSILTIKVPGEITSKFTHWRLAIATPPMLPVRYSILLPEELPDRVKIIGYPNDGPWHVSATFETRKIGPVGFQLEGLLGPGYSGGPVISDCGLVGMFINDGEGSGGAIRADVIVELLREDQTRPHILENGRKTGDLNFGARLIGGLHSPTAFDPQIQGASMGFGVTIGVPPLPIQSGMSAAVVFGEDVELGSYRAEDSEPRKVLLLAAFRLGGRYDIDGLFVGATYAPAFVVKEGHADYSFNGYEVELGYETAQVSTAGGFIAMHRLPSLNLTTFKIGWEGRF